MSAVREIIDQPDAQLGVDNNWASIYPYQIEAGLGDTLQYKLKIRNWLGGKSRLRAVFRAPEQWTVTPASVELDAAARGEAEASFQVQIPAGETRAGRRRVLTADIWRDGEHLGEITECLVNLKPLKSQ